MLTDFENSFTVGNSNKLSTSKIGRANALFKLLCLTW